MKLLKNSFFWIFIIIFTQVCLLIYFGQPIISKTGNIYLYWFNGGVEDSQQISDWYTFSHIIHGIIFYFLAIFIFKNYKNRFNYALLFAVGLESFWEVLENSPVIIDRYRQTAIAAGYFGDSILNSFFDVIWMICGFFFAKRFGWKVAIIVVIFFEILTLYFIRDNLTLNILMLIHPFETINAWQIAG